MSRPIVDYLIALAVCLGAAIAYRVTVVPILTPHSGEAVFVRENPTDLPGPDLSDVFPADSWQRGRPKLLQASWGVLLFEQWEQVAPDRWQVKPVSVVLRREAEELQLGPSGALPQPPRDGSTVIMDAPEGAIIHFAEPLNMLSGGAPPIEGGQLVGPVHIYNEPSPEFADKALDLRARNVRIDSRQIRTSESIDLRVSGARISGRDLTIHLTGGGTLPTGSAHSPLSVLDSMELIYLDDLSVPLPSGGLWEPLPESMAADSPAAAPREASGGGAEGEDAAPPGKLSVRCGGRVVFDFTDHSLRLVDGVEVRHRGGLAQDDTFRCRELLVQLVDPFSESATRDRERAEGAMKAAATIRKVEAFGAPIRVNLPSLASQMNASELVVDVAAGTLRLGGPADSNVELVHRGFRFTVPELTYQMNLAAPEELGTLVTRGQGLLRCEDPAIPVRRVSWQETLQVLKDADGHHLWAAGQVRATTSDGGTVGSDSVLLTFQLPGGADAQPSADGPVDSGAAQSTAAGPARGLLAGLRPEQFRANGNVVFDTSMLEAEAELLQVWFEHLAPSAEATPPPLAGPQLKRADGGPLRLWVTGPDGTGDSGAVAPMAGPRAKLRGRTIQANLVLREGAIVARDMSVVKDVRLEHELQTEAGPQPLVYTGDSLRLVSGEGEDLIQIAGRPARLGLGDGYFQGPLVLISGSQNRVWIRDSGTFQMPSSVLPEGNGGAMRWAGPPRCEFRGELTFDGQTVEIGSEVRLSARMAIGQAADLWDVLATAPRLEMTLDRGVQVMAPTHAREAGVERVSLIGDEQEVRLTATKLDASGVPLSRHVLENPRLDFFATSGELRGAGPGWYRSWSATDGKSPLRSVAPAGSLLSTHLIYSGGIEGNLSRQQIDFVRGVRVGLGAVTAWDQQLDAATMTQLQLNQGTVDCERLRVGTAAGTKVSSGPAARVPWEMQALGGVAFRMMSERGLVDGTATRVAYDAGGDLFVLEGSPQRAAVVRQTGPTGQPGLNIQMPIFTLRPETLEIEAQIQGATLGALPRVSR